MSWMRMVLLALLVGGTLPFAATPARAVEVEASGLAAILAGNIGSARTQALLNAQRSAVEQGVGVVLDSKTLQENFQIIQDQILTSSKGYVTKFVIPDGRIFFHTLHSELGAGCGSACPAPPPTGSSHGCPAD